MTISASASRRDAKRYDQTGNVEREPFETSARRHAAEALLAARAYCCGACKGGGGSSHPAAARPPIRGTMIFRSPMSNGHSRPHAASRTTRCANCATRCQTCGCATAPRPRRRAQCHERSHRRHRRHQGRQRRPDGRKFVFAMRGPLMKPTRKSSRPGASGNTTSTTPLRRVITSDTIAHEGHDVAPHYLPDGRIVFTSTRQRQSQAILRDEGKPRYDAQTDNRNEKRLRAARDEGRRHGHPPDLLQPEPRPEPTVLDDGRLMWSRWATRPRHPPLHRQSRRHEPAAAVRRAQPRDRHQRLDHPVPSPRPADGRLIARVRPFRTRISAAT